MDSTTYIILLRHPDIGAISKPIKFTGSEQLDERARNLAEVLLVTQGRRGRIPERVERGDSCARCRSSPVDELSRLLGRPYEKGYLADYAGGIVVSKLLGEEDLKNMLSCSDGSSWTRPWLPPCSTYY